MANLTEEEYKQLLQLGSSNEDLESQIAMQLMMAKQLQGTRPETRQFGRVAVAPTGMELIGGLAREAASAQRLQQAQADHASIVKNRRIQNELIMKGLAVKKAEDTAAQISGPGLNPGGGPSNQGMSLGGRPSNQGIPYG